MKKTAVVIGGGISGLSAAWQLLETGYGDVIVLEKGQNVGGLCGTIRVGDFNVDYGPHKIYSIIPGIVDKTVSLFAKEELICHEKKNRLFLLGEYLAYPIRLLNLLGVIGIFKSIGIGFSYGLATVKKVCGLAPDDDTYEHYICSRFGKRLYEMVFKPLAQKVWGSPETLSADIARTRIPASGAMDVLLRMIGLKKETQTDNASTFHYPKKGFGEVPKKIADRIKESGGRIICGVETIRYAYEKDKVVSISWVENGETNDQAVDLVVSAYPLGSFAEAVSSCLPQSVQDDIASLQHRHVLLVYVEVEKEAIMEDHWVFVSDSDIIFSRVYEPKRLSSELGPAGRTILCCDLTASDDDYQWKLGDQELIAQCVDGLVKMGMIDSGEVGKSYVVRKKDFYPRYNVGYLQKMKSILSVINKTFSNVILTGRLGMYNYNNYDHCMDMGMLVGDLLSQGESPQEVNTILFDTSMNYRIVD